MSKIEMEELRFDRQIRETGISSDYFNEGVVIIFHVKNLLEKQNKKLQKQLLEEIKNFHSYSEYMTKKNETCQPKLKGFVMADFLTDRGKQIAKRLDEITIEIKNLAIEDLKIINIERISTLLEEWKNLLYE